MNSEKFVYNILPRLTDVITHKSLIQLRRFNRLWLYMFRTMSVGRVADRYNNRSDKLIAFRAYLMHLPIQGSAEWLATRAGTNHDFLRELIIKRHSLDPNYQFPPTVGGSEIAALLGEDKHKNPAGLMRSKLGIEKFDGNIHTNWGKMFEEVLRQWTETIFHTELYETGSVPGLRNEYGMPVQSYSPDGVGMVKRERLAKVLEHENIKYTQTDEYQNLISSEDPECIVLYEFKCPLMRKPDGSVPPQYRAQPRLGMPTLGIPEFAIFGDATFRKCCAEDFNFEPKYDLCMPPTARDKVKQEAPLALGFIGVYKEGGRDKSRGTDNDMKSVTRRIVNSIAGELQIKELEKLPRDINTVSLVAINLYESIMDTSLFEFDTETRMRILWNAVRTSLPDIQAKPRDEAYRTVYNAIKLIDTARTGLTDLAYGIDFGYTKYGGSRFDCLETISMEKMQAALNSSSITIEEFYNLMICANTPNNELGLKFHHPGKFCYSPSYTYATDLARNHNYIDTHLSSHKRCKKWLWQNVSEFEKFCFNEGHKSIGIIPYKLITVKYVPVYKEGDFLERVEPVIKQFQENLEKCRADNQDPTILDRRICDIYNVAPMIQSYSENSFEDIGVEGTISPNGLSFDDLNLIG
jgi:hypothetical protein